MDISKLDEDTDKSSPDQRENAGTEPLLLKRIESLAEMRDLLASGDIWLTSADDDDS